MSGIECPVCSKIRKIEIISTPDGWVNPPCWNCGDPGWTQPYGHEDDPFYGRNKRAELCPQTDVLHCAMNDHFKEVCPSCSEPVGEGSCNMTYTTWRCVGCGAHLDSRVIMPKTVHKENV